MDDQVPSLEQQPADAGAAPAAGDDASDAGGGRAELRKPRNAQKRKRDATIAAFRRKVNSAQSEEELEQLRKKMEGGGSDPDQKAANEAAPPPPPPADLVKEFKPLAEAAWQTVARILGGAGPRWELRPDEVKQLVDATAPVLAKYAPNVLASPEAVLAIAVVGVFGPRAIAEVQERRAKVRAIRGSPPKAAPEPPAPEQQEAPPPAAAAA